MISSGIYRHIHTHDIDLEVYWGVPVKDGIIVKAAVLNRHNNEVYEIKQFLINKDDVKNWVKISRRKRRNEINRGADL